MKKITPAQWRAVRGWTYGVYAATVPLLVALGVADEQLLLSVGLVLLAVLNLNPKGDADA